MALPAGDSGGQPHRRPARPTRRGSVLGGQQPAEQCPDAGLRRLPRRELPAAGCAGLGADRRGGSWRRGAASQLSRVLRVSVDGTAARRADQSVAGGPRPLPHQLGAGHHGPGQRASAGRQHRAGAAAAAHLGRPHAWFRAAVTASGEERVRRIAPAWRLGEPALGPRVRPADSSSAAGTAPVHRPPPRPRERRRSPLKLVVVAATRLGPCGCGNHTVGGLAGRAWRSARSSIVFIIVHLRSARMGTRSRALLWCRSGRNGPLCREVGCR